VAWEDEATSCACARGFFENKVNRFKRGNHD